jgi:uncharacterized protein (TIGR04255 family)
MPSEVFQFPTVKEVDFEIRFPHIFSIESRIGDFQNKIIMQFPDSQQIFHRQMMFTDIGPEGKMATVPEELAPQALKKIWVFKSPNQIEVRVQTNSLRISSLKHKTYNNPNSAEKLKDTIQFVVSNFFQVINIPIIKRIGLRYVDECPLPIKNNETLHNWYNSILPLTRFQLSDTENYYFNITTKRKNHKLTFQEALGKNEKGQEKIFLDFDAFENDIPANNYLNITDELYEIVSEEYMNIAKDPLKEFMKTGNLT